MYSERTRRKRGARGGTALSFFLGVCVAAGMCWVIYVRHKENAPAEKQIPAKKPTTQARHTAKPGPAYTLEASTDDEPDDDWLKELLADPKLNADGESSPPRPIRRTLPENAAQPDHRGGAEEDPQQPDTSNKPRPKDYIMSATKSKRYFADYGVVLHDRGRSYYLAVLLKSYRNELWAVGRTEWFRLKDKTYAISQGGSRYTCTMMWDEIWPDENCTIVKMVFVVPNGASVKEVGVASDRWAITKVGDTGH